jgi:protein-ribulosamine 3-kinase
MIPEGIRDAVINALTAAGDATPLLAEQEGVAGGVSTTCRLRTERGDYFLKWNTTPWFGTFTNEAFHLALLRDTHTVRVPEVIGFAESEEGRPAWMLQVWLDGAADEQRECRTGARLGERIAALHRTTAGMSPGYGFPERLTDGTVKLPTQDWPTFFYEALIRHHIQRSRQENRWTEAFNRRVDRLIDRLPGLFGDIKRTPCLLHGDLHSCNVRCAADGEPAVVDPWLYYGDREHEIVCTLMSGDFLPDFYDAYNAHHPLEPGFEERIDLHKLAWLLSRPDPNLAEPILIHYVG